ncbi:class I SAM-dependent methyltransferase [Corynebacterium halotolerans]|uniref:Methyltransferase type 11 domain-containing protein n=1 Tax=Corynebacterium halotolerans YIM 70093 = DSM 44683 TaxID=1121362 RepID=M1NSG4_9CORY|nr:class I SAM-dependent methyltransferase [Corynebacterium halotolerans]AGF72407.1 hypothetical protein A605_07025 [Corynebacterium halotolerans YIM 70093 = DSM 44683]
MHPQLSRQHGPQFHDDAHRHVGARAFATGADIYDDVRPGYPADVVSLLAGAHRVADVGAGTGKLTTALVDAGHEVVASDPSPDMVRVLAARGLPTVRATAETTALADASVDAVACAQTWHWVDTLRASAEFDRVVRPGGKVLLVWNNLDVSHPWIHRLARIMHSGDVHKEGFIPPVAAPWRITHTLRTRWIQHLTPEQIHLLTQTRSYWLRSDEKVRARVTENLRWYLFDRLEFAPGQLLAIPYRCDAFVLER